AVKAVIGIVAVVALYFVAATAVHFTEPHFSFWPYTAPDDDIEQQDSIAPPSSKATNLNNQDKATAQDSTVTTANGQDDAAATSNSYYNPADVSSAYTEYAPPAGETVAEPEVEKPVVKTEEPAAETKPEVAEKTGAVPPPPSRSKGSVPPPPKKKTATGNEPIPSSY
ncbi:MAG: hypothetical protein KBT13_00220, partial [Bacteroidales bacterium]|nr:hypothetical protein [Candidatus Sodaliphilus limicaballi]